MPTPHDKLVRRTFGDLQHARGLLRSLVPDALSSRVDWRTLALVDGRFIDPQLAERQTDLLYTVELEQRPVLLYLLLEHQSSSDRWMPLRMLVYMTRIWARHREQHPDAVRLPAIVPMVLHHSAKGWSAPTSLIELLDVDPVLRGCLEPYVVDFQFRLIDLTRQDDREVRGLLTTDLGKLVGLALKHGAYDTALESRLVEWVDLLGRVMRTPGGVAGLEVVGRYLLEVSDLTAQRLRHVLESALDPEVLEAVMTGAERLRAEGRAEALLQLLDQKFGPLPDEVTERVLGASVQELEAWTGRVLSAASLELLLN